MYLRTYALNVNTLINLQGNSLEPSGHRG